MCGLTEKKSPGNEVEGRNIEAFLKRRRHSNPAALMQYKIER